MSRVRRILRTAQSDVGWRCCKSFAPKELMSGTWLLEARDSRPPANQLCRQTRAPNSSPIVRWADWAERMLSAALVASDVPI